MTIRFAPVTPAAKRLNSWALPLGAPKPYPCGEQLDYEPTAEDLADWNAWLDRCGDLADDYRELQQVPA